jgi:ribosomal protein S15P/S13E
MVWAGPYVSSPNPSHSHSCFFSVLVQRHQVTGWRKGQTLDETKQANSPTVETLSASRTIEVGEKYFDGITQAMQTLVKEYREAGKDLQQPAVQNELQMDFASRANAAGEAALDAVGVTMDQFEASVKAHQKDENVARALAMMQMRQQQLLQGMATAPM